MVYLHGTDGETYVVNSNLIAVAVRRGDLTHLEFANGNFLNVKEQLSEIFGEDE